MATDRVRTSQCNVGLIKNLTRSTLCSAVVVLVLAAPVGAQVSAGSPIRQKLTASLTLYVGGTYLNSSDSNDCLSFANQCATVQGAVNKAYNLYDTQGNNINITVCAACTATYTGAVVVSGPLVGGGVLTINGNGVPVLTSTSSVSTLLVQNGANVSTQNISYTNTGSGSCLTSTVNGILTVSTGVVVGSCGAMQLAVSAGGTAVVTALTIASGAVAQAAFHVPALGNLNMDGATITCGATNPTYSLYFIGVGSAYAEAIGTTFSGCGSVTGPHFTVNRNGAIRANSSDINVAGFFPGSAQGTLTANGVFDSYGSTSFNVTVANLPTCIAGIKGVPASVSDATAWVTGGALTGGGSTWAGVICNGTAWVYM